MYLTGTCCNECEEEQHGLGLNPIQSGAVYGGGGMEFDPMQLVEMASSFVPGGQMFVKAFAALEDYFNIGAGRTEADIIVPFQNEIMARLDEITDALVRNPAASTLQAMYREVGEIGQRFRAFVSDSRLTDGRASEQALNDVMPYIDGSCGYHWPPPMMPDSRGCLRWGDGTPGGPGTDGMLGAIGRAIVRRGGMIPSPTVTQGPGVPSLSYPWPGTAQLPQAGTLPPRVQQRPLQAGIVPVGGGSSAALPILLGAGALLLFSRR